MAPTFLELPLEIRERIYSWVFFNNDVWMSTYPFLGESPAECRKYNITPRTVESPLTPYPPLGEHDPFMNLPDAPLLVLRPEDCELDDVEDWLQQWLLDNEAKLRLPALHKLDQHPPRAITGCPLDFLYVCHQINAEATPIFFQETHFVMDMEAHRAMLWLESLSRRARDNVTTLSFTVNALRAGNRKVDASLHSGYRNWPRKPMHPSSPFALYLATKLPKLSNVAFENTPNCGCDCYPGAGEDLQYLLYFGRIKKLSYFYCTLTRDLMEWLRDPKETVDGEECFDQLLDPNLVDGRFTKMVEADRALEQPKSDDYESEEVREWDERYQEWVWEHTTGFRWHWGDRTRYTGADGATVHAVIEMTNPGHDKVARWNRRG